MINGKWSCIQMILHNLVHSVEVLTNFTRAISNFEYENIENDEKSSIYLLKPGYVQQLLNDMRFDMLYGKIFRIYY